MMEKRLNKISENMTEEQADRFEESFSDFGADSPITEEQTDRILSSFMRKAGLEMNETNSIISQKRDIRSTVTGVSKDRSVSRIYLKRGGAIAACIALIAAGGVMFSLKNNVRNVVPNTERDSSVTNNDSDLSEVKETDNSQTEDKPVSETRSVQAWAKPYVEQNGDTVGYLKLKDLSDSGDFEAPVVQGDDNEFYLHHGFDKAENETGTVFADCNVPIDEKGQPSNIVLYGYYTDKADEISSSPILKYKDSKFFEKHQTIDFCTVFDDADTKYQVIYCFNYDAKDHAGYVAARDFEDENSFDTWISTVKKSAINKSEIECTENDDYLTLVTEDRSAGEDGRFAVVAKKINSGDEEVSETKDNDTDGNVKDSKKDNKTDNRNDAKIDISKDNGVNNTNYHNSDNENSVDGEKSNTKTENKTDGKKADPVVLKKPEVDVYSKLSDAYPDQTVYMINDNRYIIYDSDVDSLMVYDVHSDSVIATISDFEMIMDVFEDKFGVYKYEAEGNNKYAYLIATIYDDSGNLIYEYKVDTKASGLLEKAPDVDEIKFSPDGQRLVYRKTVFIEDDNHLDIADIFYCINYSDQKKAVKLAYYNGKYYALNFAVSNDLLLVEHVTVNNVSEYKKSMDLYSIDDPDTSVNDVFTTFYFGVYPRYVAQGSTILCSVDHENNIVRFKPDDNGDIRIGNKYYSKTVYTLAGAGKGLKTNALISEHGRYAVSVYINDNNKLVFTLYEITDDNVTELRTIETDLVDPEYDAILNLELNEQSGMCSIRRVIKSDKPVDDNYRIDSVEFFE
jgi:SrtB family sortase